MTPDKYHTLIQVVDNEGRNVMHQAVLMGDENVLEITLIVPLLVTNNFAIGLECDNKGRTAYDYAIMFKRQPKMLSVLNSYTFSTRYRMFEEACSRSYPDTDDKMLKLLNKHLFECCQWFA